MLAVYANIVFNVRGRSPTLVYYAEEKAGSLGWVFKNLIGNMIFTCECLNENNINCVREAAAPSVFLLLAVKDNDMT